MKLASKMYSAIHTGMVIFIMSSQVALAMDEGAMDEARPRARDIGLVVGTFPTGRNNAITDVEGVLVGHSTKIEGEDTRTGVTAIIPAPGNLYTHPIPAWVHIGNGYGKMVGETQVREFGEIETPIILSCTLCVWSAAKGLNKWMYEQEGMGEHTLNPIVGETNDSRVNNMWIDPIGYKEVAEALNSAKAGPVEEGSIGAGTGTQAFGWKGGIGSSSRVIPKSLGGYTVGVLVQTNFGGTLSMNGAPVGRELENYSFKKELEAASQEGTKESANLMAYDPARDSDKEDGSIMIIVATDAPLDSKTLDRLAMRAIMGLARTGSFASNGSGDYVIAFSTDPDARRPRFSPAPVDVKVVVNDAMSPLFAAAAEATEEAIYNAILKATTVSSSRGELTEISIPEVKKILKKYRVLNWDKSISPR